MDMSAAYAKGVGMALPEALISCDRFHVVAMAVDAMDKVRQVEMRDEPQAVAAALGTIGRKTIKGLMWGMRKNPDGWSQHQTNAMHWLQHSSAEERARMEAEDGAARGLCASRSEQRWASRSG